jgi:hypothetical protein
MASIDEIGQEKQRISERLARLYAERTRLGDQLNELEMAERVLTRFGGKADSTAGRGEDARRELRRRQAGSAEPEAPRKLQLDAQRRLFEGSAGAWRRRHSQRNPELSLIGIRDDGQAEPPWCRAAAPPSCRPARQPRSALVPAVPNRPPITRGTEGSNPYLSSVKSYCEPDSSREKTHWAPALLKTARL